MCDAALHVVQLEVGELAIGNVVHGANLLRAMPHVVALQLGRMMNMPWRCAGQLHAVLHINAAAVAGQLRKGVRDLLAICRMHHRQHAQQHVAHRPVFIPVEHAPQLQRRIVFLAGIVMNDVIADIGQTLGRLQRGFAVPQRRFLTQSFRDVANKGDETRWVDAVNTANRQLDRELGTVHPPSLQGHDPLESLDMIGCGSRQIHFPKKVRQQLVDLMTEHVRFPTAKHVFSRLSH